MTIEAISERLDGLQRENQRLRWIATAIFVGAVVIVVEARFGNSIQRVGTIEAEKLVIRDKEGHVRATLGLDAIQQPGLVMFDRKGSQQLAVELPSEGSAAVTLFDKGDTRVALDSHNDGSSALRFFDKAQQSSSAMFMWPDSTAGLVFNGGSRGQGVTMGVQPNGRAAVFTTDAAGMESGRVGEKTVDNRSLGLVHGPKPTRGSLNKDSTAVLSPILDPAAPPADEMSPPKQSISGGGFVRGVSN